MSWIARRFPLVLLAFLAATLASANGVGNGGDRIATEFIAHAWEVMEMLATPENHGLLTSQQTERMNLAIRATRVEVKDSRLVERNGMTVDARVIDDPRATGKKLIQLYRPRWEEYLQKQASVHRLVFHEYLWVIDQDDSSNQISGRLKFPAALQNPGKPIERLPEGVYEGRGTLRGPDGDEERYKVKLIVRNNSLSEEASDAPKNYRPPHLKLIYQFYGNGFFDVSDNQSREPYGQGFCSNHQCMAVIEAPELIMETISFAKGYVFRQGYVNEGGHQYSWDEKMTLVRE